MLTGSGRFLTEFPSSSARARRKFSTTKLCGTPTDEIPMTDDLYTQINDRCNVDAIKALLRNISERSAAASTDIRISGLKEDLIRHLRIAVEQRHAQPEELRRLLWNSEEVGKQHILLLSRAPAEFSTSPPAANIENGAEVAAALFGEPWKNRFPRYEFPTSGAIWSDFRIDENGGWLGKAYGRELYRQSEGVVATEELDGGVQQEIRQYSLKVVKTTLVARWRPTPPVLELRVDNSNLQTTKAIEERQKQLWTLLQPAFQNQHLVGLGVDNLLNCLIFERHTPENQERYSISRVELTDPRSGLIRVMPYDSEALDHDVGRKRSLEAMQANDFRPSSARVEWKCGLEGCPADMTEPVPVVVEKTSNGPELRIRKQITSDTYEYIYNQLRSRL